MSLKERDAEDVKEPVAIPDGWKDTGERCGNGSPIVTDGYSRRILASNGGLLNIGNPGPHPGAGRPAEKVRKDATESLEEHVATLGIALGRVTNRALDELEKGNVANAASLLGQSSRIATTLGSIGPGTKVTNVVESPELLEVFDKAMTEEGIPNDQALAVMVRVKKWLEP